MLVRLLLSSEKRGLTHLKSKKKKDREEKKNLHIDESKLGVCAGLVNFVPPKKKKKGHFGGWVVFVSDDLCLVCKRAKKKKKSPTNFSDLKKNKNIG